MKYCAVLAVSASLYAQTVINGDRSIVGKWDASAATGTSPVQVGTSANLPASCAVGQMYFASDATPGRKLRSCTAANTWTTLAYDQGAAAGMPGACAVGQIYFVTDATPGRNLYFCTATNTWTQMAAAGGGSGAGNTLVAWSGQQSPTNLNANADNTIFSVSIPGGALTAGGCFSVRVLLKHTLGMATTDFKIMYGAGSYTWLSSSTTTPVAAEITLCNNPGATDAQQATVYGAAINTNIFTSLPGTSFAVDSAATQTLAIVVNPGNNPGQQVQGLAFLVQKII